MPSREQRYPNFNWKPPREGRTLVVFKGRVKPPPQPGSKKPANGSATDRKRPS